MIIAGVMSGTSADGIDVALVRVPAGKRSHARSFEFLLHHHCSYPKPVRKAVLAAMNNTQASVADLSRLSFLLGELYADTVGAARRRARIGRIDLVGCHGQTIYHQGEAATYLGRKIACTWQLGEPAAIAARLGIPVVSDFRPADMAAGGKGAPLVPFLDYMVFRDRRVGRIVQNLGGIANLTAIPAGAGVEDVLAFDTGPGNMVIDQLMQALYGKPLDREGAVARAGTILKPLLEAWMRAPYFRRRPPKTAGREQFGRQYVAGLLRQQGRASRADLIATATALTARSIGESLRRFVLPFGGYRDYIVSGGGTRNTTLVRLLAEETSSLGLTLRHSDEFGVPSQAKEAIAFALLAYQTWRRKPGNLPAATGARRPAILGGISYV
jgi:anhydro-N-acetylmuramic acid kinase